MSIAKTSKALKSVFICVLLCPRKLVTTKLFISLHGLCGFEFPAGVHIGQNFFSGCYYNNFGYRTSVIGMGGSTTGNYSDEASIFLTTLKCLDLCYLEDKA